MSHKMKEDIERQSVIHRSPELTDFQKRVNSAAAKIKSSLVQPRYVPREGPRTDMG